MFDYAEVAKNVSMFSNKIAKEKLLYIYIYKQTNKQKRQDTCPVLPKQYVAHLWFS